MSYSPKRRQSFRNLAIGFSGCLASVGLFAVTANGEDRLLPELPQTTTPVRLVAASDQVTGKSEFRYREKNTPPVIRVQPGSVLKVEYKNELAAQSREDCFGHPCMNMTNLHFHGLHVSPNAPQDDVLDMMASPGETLHCSGFGWNVRRYRR
jgi:FtsP/CotA-like multicopper oxidase with cupredoxin domain